MLGKGSEGQRIVCDQLLQCDRISAALPSSSRIPQHGMCAPAGSGSVQKASGAEEVVSALHTLLGFLLPQAPPVLLPGVESL